MKNKILSLLAISCALYSSAPSKLIEPARFYSEDFKHQTDMKYIHLETKIGILGDEVHLGRPRVYVNDSIVLCNCGKEAVNICFKKGELFATCEKCGPKPEPVNAVKYGNPEKKPKEINGKK